jgi:phosphatidylglycerophosphate synthase
MDVHGRLMKAYKQVPEWWFLILLFGSMAVSILMALVWKTDVQLPWWGMIFAFALAFVVTLPIGVIQATTNQVLTQSFLPFLFITFLSIVSYYFDAKRKRIEV